MGRRSSRPAAGRRPAPRPASPRPPARSASTRAAPPPARRPASQTAPPPQKTSPQQAPPPAPAAAPPGGSAMGGFMANVASTGLGVMAGRAMDRTFFGGGSAPPAEAAPVDEAPADYSSEYAIRDSPEVSQSVCAREALEFKKCMERTSSDVASCQWNLDILAACQQQQQQTGFADAGRF